MSFLASAIGVGLAILFQNQNLAFLIVMGSAVAASTTFPLLIMTIYWRGLTTEGAIACGLVGLLSSVGLIILSPVCWVDVLGFSEPVFPSSYPSAISVPLAFLAAFLVSQLTRAEGPCAPDYQLG